MEEIESLNWLYHFQIKCSLCLGRMLGWTDSCT